MRKQDLGIWGHSPKSTPKCHLPNPRPVTTPLPTHSQPWHACFQDTMVRKITFDDTGEMVLEDWLDLLLFRGTSWQVTTDRTGPCAFPEQELTSSLSLLCNSQHSSTALRINVQAVCQMFKMRIYFIYMVKFTSYLKIIETMKWNKCFKFMTHEKREKRSLSKAGEHAWKPKETLLIPAADSRRIVWQTEKFWR